MLVKGATGKFIAHPFKIVKGHNMQLAILVSASFEVSDS